MYLEWNDALASGIFRSEASGRPVYLYVTDELISHTKTRLGAGSPDLAEAAKTGPPWVTRQGICQKALQAYDGWRNRHLPYPPYIGYLALFSWAGGAEGEWAPHAYYPRLWKLLGEDRDGMLPSFDRMFELWDDLEQWSTKDMAGTLGIFRAKSAGSWIHVGYPIAQTILTEYERKQLPLIFASSGLDPTAPPSEMNLARVLRLNGSSLRRRTIDLLSGRQDADAFGALMDVVGQELLDWDGEVPNIGQATPAQQPQVQGTLRLCLRLDSVAARAEVTVRCRLNREFPEAELVLSGPRGSTPLVCEEDLAGWSTQLRYSDRASPVDSSSFDWINGATFREERLRWQFKLPGNGVRLFISGATEGLPGLVEVNELPRSQPFHILFRDTDWTRLEEWGRLDCVDFKEISIVTGLPRGWRVASVTKATSDARVRQALPTLSFSELLRIGLRNGLRSSAGNNFFAFAPPQIILSGGNGGEQVACNGDPLTFSEIEGAYLLPPNLPVESRIVVEARQKEVVKTQSLYLTSDVVWAFGDPVEQFDEWGRGAEPTSGEARIAGSMIVGDKPVPVNFRRSPTLAKGLGNLSGNHLLLLGRCPGQVLRWPDEPLSAQWQPVWAIVPGRRSRAIYCGDGISTSKPAMDSSVSDRRRRRLWAEIF